MRKLGQIFFSSLLLIGSCFAADQENAYVASRNSFNFALLKALGTPTDNITISPYNIASALDLAYFGDDKTTKSEMSECLRLPMMADRAFIEEIKKCETSLGRSATNARAIALDTGFLPTDYYLETVKDKLGAQAFEVNFSKRPQDACESINAWASNMTKGRITNLLSPSDVSAATKMVLLSAIYIKADWVQAFAANKTRDDTFRSISGKDNTVKMMQQTKNMRLFQNDSVDVVWMDLKQNNPNDS
ncbi:MAG: hypothetical protein LLF94_10510, partial [Chlamydiales bacterium]|nr:hypothetical protein [Chlamydiales bacterium]